MKTANWEVLRRKCGIDDNDPFISIQDLNSDGLDDYDCICFPESILKELIAALLYIKDAKEYSLCEE